MLRELVLKSNYMWFREVMQACSGAYGAKKPVEDPDGRNHLL